MTQKVEDPRWSQGDVVRVPFTVGKTREIQVDCVVLDSRRAYGRDDWLVVPVKGGDTPIWVRAETILGEAEK